MPSPTLHFALLLSYLAAWSPTAVAQIHTVSSKTELEALVGTPNVPGKARPGDTIILRAGTYRDWGTLTIPASASGTPQAPLTLRGESIPNRPDERAVFVGRTQFIIDARDLRLENLHFREAGAPVIHARGTSSNPAWRNRYSNLSFTRCGQGCTPTSACNLPVFHFDQYARLSRLDHSEFRETDRGISVLMHYLASGNRIDSNRFVDIHTKPNGPTNGLDAIHIGSAERGEIANYRYGHPANRTHALIDHNLFLRVTGEKEIVSLKSWGSRVLFNLFLDSDSGLVSLRAGGENEVSGNVFHRTNGGISIQGQSQLVTGNLIVPRRMLTRGNMQGSGALEFMIGSDTPAPASQLVTYVSARKSRIERNTVLAGRYTSDAPSSALTLQRSTSCGGPPCDRMPFGNEFIDNFFWLAGQTPLALGVGQGQMGLYADFTKLNPTLLLPSAGNAVAAGEADLPLFARPWLRALEIRTGESCFRIDRPAAPGEQGARFETVSCDGATDEMLRNEPETGHAPVLYPVILPRIPRQILR